VSLGTCQAVDEVEARALVNVIGPALRGLLSSAHEPLRMVTFDDSDSVIELVARDGVPGLAMAAAHTRPDRLLRVLPALARAQARRIFGRLASAHCRRRGGLHQGTPRTTDCGAGPKPGNVHLRAHVADANTARLVYLDAIK